ncbi:MAG: LicD family protein [Anaerostipes hadrus]|jgi:lipopolysaccharide cholinephosphotransferase|nr:MAG: LicD family protein [Anaerostipes hadrus]
MNGCIKEELNIEQIHKATLGIVEKLIEICDKINVNYYVAYGSLIGVVRHKGFIPWDDDFDVVMLRDDYEKFCDYCIKNENKLKPFKLLSRKCEKKYPYNIARLNNMNYKAVYDNVQGYESGIFIDIYPLDGAGSDVDKVLKKVEKKKSNLFRITLWSIDDHYTKSTYNKWYRSIIKYFVRGYSKVRGAKHFLDKMENFKNLYDINNSRYIAEMTWDSGLTLYEKSWFDKYIYMDFENLKVKVPIGYDDFLRCHYGDYMKFPPKEEQVPHHEYKVYQR